MGRRRSAPLGVAMLLGFVAALVATYYVSRTCPGTLVNVLLAFVASPLLAAGAGALLGGALRGWGRPALAILLAIAGLLAGFLAGVAVSEAGGYAGGCIS